MITGKYINAKSLILILIVLVAGLALSVGLSVYETNIVSAQANLACDGLSPTTAGGSCAAKNATEPNVGNTLSTVINLMSAVAGIISVIMIIIAGVKFMTSQGDAGKVASARSTVIYAVIGLVIVVVSQGFVFFVLDRV